MRGVEIESGQNTALIFMQDSIKLEISDFPQGTSIFQSSLIRRKAD
jgi:hypothetical protein